MTEMAQLVHFCLYLLALLLVVHTLCLEHVQDNPAKRQSLYTCTVEPGTSLALVEPVVSPN